MKCELHSPIAFCIQRKKPRGWHNGKAAWYEDEIWESSLDRGGLGWASQDGAEFYGEVLHGELHGAKTIDEAIKLARQL